jgi:hypothetical protein
MSYRDMVRDAGLDPDSDEGRRLAAHIEEEEERRFRAPRWQCRRCGAYNDSDEPFCLCQESKGEVDGEVKP